MKLSRPICKEKGCTRNADKGRAQCGMHHMRVWRLSNPIRAIYTTLKNNAKRRKIMFDLTVSEFSEFVTSTGYINKRGRTSESLTIDRMDNDKGYTITNIECLTKAANIEKYYSIDKLKEAVFMPEFEIDPF